MTRPQHTIDLGVLPPADQQPAPAAAPPWWRRHRWAGGRTWHWWPAAAVAAALALSTTAAAPATPGMSLLFTVPAGDGHMITDGPHLYLISGDSTRMTAYRLADGTEAWTFTAEDDGWFTVEGGVPMRVSHPRDRRDYDGISSVTGLDPATGEPRWTQPGAPTIVTDDGLVVIHDAIRVAPDIDGTSRDADDAMVGKTAVDPATGEIEWRLRKHPQAIDHDSRFMINRRYDAITSYDLTTGTEVAHVTDLRPSLAGPYVAGDLVFIWQRSLDPIVVAYEVDTLAQRWRVPLPGMEGIQDCGPVVCGYTGAEVVGLDRDTGAQQWSVELPVNGSGSPWVQSLPDPWPEGTALLRFAGSATSHSWILDTHTGDAVVDLTGWEPRDVSSLVTRQVDGVTWVGRVMFDPPQVRILGPVGHDAGWCHPAEPFLVCQSQHQIQVWQLRRRLARSRYRDRCDRAVVSHRRRES